MLYAFWVIVDFGGDGRNGIEPTITETTAVGTPNLITCFLKMEAERCSEISVNITRIHRVNRQKSSYGMGRQYFGRYIHDSSTSRPSQSGEEQLSIT
jgi:hypothetical protein